MAVTNKRQAPYPATAKDGVIIGTSRLRKTRIGVISTFATLTSAVTNALSDSDGNTIVLNKGEIISNIMLCSENAITSVSAHSATVSLGHTTTTCNEYMAAYPLTSMATSTVKVNTAAASYATPYAVTGTNTVYYQFASTAAYTLTGGPLYVVIETVDLFGGKRGSEAAATAANTVPV